MQTRTRDLFLTVRTEGAILPSDLLERIAAGDRDLGGLTPEAYHLPEGEKITETTNRAWNRLLAAWSAFRNASERLPDTDAGTTLTREKWLLPLLHELGYGRLLTAKAAEIDGKSYAISHGWHQTPIHLLGLRVDLDRPSQRVAGASRSSPHSLLQEFLNRSKEHLWGVVSNGLRLRILRDNASLTRQSYVEFDLEAMMLGEGYSDFVLLWLLCHQSRVEAESPSDCWLEKWSQSSRDRGVRALEQLRTGVEEAITCLGRGFLAYSANGGLRARLRSGALDAQDYYRQVLRLVYRLLFLFVAEDRGLLLLPGEEMETARLRYVRHYSTARLRRLAERRSGTRHGDLYVTLRLAMQKLGSDTGCPELALPALGSFLFSPTAMPDIEDCDIANHDLLDAVRALAVTVADGALRSVDYKNLGAEELGSVYESLLELRPELNPDVPLFGLTTASGHERKTSGSYYTPTSLIDCLLDTALEPVLDEAARKPDAVAAILALKVVDPACGSGHFLIAAAHRIAKRLASAQFGDEEPSPDATRKALRNVIGHCIYGVDVNPMAVELCKVNLWLEALDPGKPLSFLDHRIQPGNSLLGAIPTIMEQGIPDAAFDPIEGDSKEACAKWRRVNKSERAAWKKKQGWLGFDAPLGWLMNYAVGLAALDSVGDDAISGIREKERRYAEVVHSSHYLDGKFLADSWCAAFVWKKDSLTEFPISEQVYREIEKNPTAFYQDKVTMSNEIRRLARQYCFFHWHLAFPDVFRPAEDFERASNRHAGWNGGFDVVLGNPPWERIKLQEKEWFASRRPDIVSAGNASVRRRMIQDLRDSAPSLLAAFQEAVRRSEAESQLIRNTGRFPLCGKGDVNTYAVFAENSRLLIGGCGRVGYIVPSGIATDESTSEFFADLVEQRQLVSLFDFENRENLFPGVGHGRMKFTLLTIGYVESARFGFQLWNVGQLSAPDRVFTLSATDIRAINPNTRTCPIFRTKRDADLTRQIYSRVSVLIHEGSAPCNPWALSFFRMFDMTNDSHLFRTAEQLAGDGYSMQGNWFVKDSSRAFLPLYEAKMASHYDHRYGTYEGRHESRQSTALDRPTLLQKRNPNFMALPRFWVEEIHVAAVDWLLGFRDITHSTNDRTFIAHILPKCAAGNSVIGAQTDRVGATPLLLANFCTFVFDYITRQKIGGLHLNLFVVKQLAVLPPEAYFDGGTARHGVSSLADFVGSRVVELTFTATDIAPFAVSVGCNSAPFAWDDGRRFTMRCELDALYFHLYGISREDAAYILDTFPIIREREMSEFGEYRTKVLILEIYGAMAEAARTGVEYQTRLHPPPADARVAHASAIASRTPAQPMLVPSLDLVASGAWATPPGIQPGNFVLLAVTEVLHRCGGPVDPHRVWMAVHFVRNPAMALAFLDKARMKDWVRVIGPGAHPVQKNVVDISRFQRGATDQLWGDAIIYLKSIGAMVESSGQWSVTSLAPAAADEEWLAGRADMAVRLALQLADEQETELRLAEFLRSVKDGTARRAVS